MSDFLSNFDKKNYKKTIDGRQNKKKPTEPAIEKEEVELPIEMPHEETENVRVETPSFENEYSAEADSVDLESDLSGTPSDEIKKWQEEISNVMADFEIDSPNAEQESADYSVDDEASYENTYAEVRPWDDAAEESDLVAEARQNLVNEDLNDGSEPDANEVAELTATRTSRGGEEETEVDPTYQKRKRRKIVLIAIGSIVAAIALFLIYYSFTHVKMPKFTGKPVAEVRAWATENKVKLEVEQEYNFDREVNTVIKQGAKAGKQIKKKAPLVITASLGPDPEEVVPLPDFSKLSKTAAEEWVKENKAENLSILEEYHDKIEKGKFVRQEISNKEVKPETYKRQDQAVVYFSKGQEVFEKDIAVPDFKGKPRSEVETWVKTNEIKMEYKKVDSDTVEEGLIISQNIEKGKKVAKRDAMSVEVSTGKAIVVPNFADLTPETAATVEGLAVTVKEVFAADTTYGQLLSQTIEAGTKVAAKEPQKITVTYSAGQPYLRSYYGQLEGDLDKLFYQDYRSKGANIRFTTYYVDSSEMKGTVVKMDAYNQYVPIDYVVGIGISNGSKAGDPASNPVAPPGDGGGEEPDAGAAGEAPE